MSSSTITSYSLSESTIPNASQYLRLQVKPPAEDHGFVVIGVPSKFNQLLELKRLLPKF